MMSGLLSAENPPAGAGACAVKSETVSAAAPRMPKRSKERDKEWRALEISQKRSHMVLGALVGIFVVCFLRAGYLQCFNTDFLQKQGEVRYARTLEIAAGRGQIFDRNGVVLAATLPARSIWATTNLVTATPQQISQLSDLLGVSERTLQKRLARKDAFVNLARQVEMEKIMVRKAWSWPMTRL